MLWILWGEITWRTNRREILQHVFLLRSFLYNYFVVQYLLELNLIYWCAVFGTCIKSKKFCLGFWIYLYFNTKLLQLLISKRSYNMFSCYKVSSITTLLCCIYWNSISFTGALFSVRALNVRISCTMVFVFTRILTIICLSCGHQIFSFVTINSTPKIFLFSWEILLHQIISHLPLPIKEQAILSQIECLEKTNTIIRFANALCRFTGGKGIFPTFQYCGASTKLPQSAPSNNLSCRRMHCFSANIMSSGKWWICVSWSKNANVNS